MSHEETGVPPQEVNTFFEKMRALQEPKGYYFNKDTAFAKGLIEQLIALRKNMGYAPCPCRLANGTREADKDIICPCEYREEDVREYGVCFCGLYASKEWNEGSIPHTTVPERRPPEKILF